MMRPRTVIVIVDFDNVFRDNISNYTNNSIIKNSISSAIDLILESIDNVENILVKMYGGWYQEDVLTNKASTILSIIPDIETLFPMLYGNKRVYGSVELAFKLTDVEHEWHYTYKEQRGLPGLRIKRDAMTDCCHMNHDTCPIHILRRFIDNKRECLTTDCKNKISDTIFMHKSQKMVDTMMACDIMSAYDDKNAAGICIMSEDIDLFPALALGRSKNSNIPIYIKLEHIRPSAHYEIMSNKFNINILPA